VTSIDLANRHRASRGFSASAPAELVNGYNVTSLPVP